MTHVTQRSTGFIKFKIVTDRYNISFRNFEIEHIEGVISEIGRGFVVVFVMSHVMCSLYLKPLIALHSFIDRNC